MQKLSHLVSETYKKYLPLAEKCNIELNLDIADVASCTDDVSAKEDLEHHVSSALGRCKKGKVSLAVRERKIIIKDNGTILSKPACALLSHGRVKAKSRLGFGTTITIDFTSNNNPQKA